MSDGGAPQAEAAARQALASLAEEELRGRKLRYTLSELVLAVACRPVAQEPGPLRAGSRWAGTVGGRAFLLLVSHRKGTLIEAVGIRPGQSATRISGWVDDHRCASNDRLGGGQPAGSRVTLCELETLLGDQTSRSHLELTLLAGMELRGFLRRSREAAPGQVRLPTRAGGRAPSPPEPEASLPHSGRRSEPRAWSPSVAGRGSASAVCCDATHRRDGDGALWCRGSLQRLPCGWRSGDARVCTERCRGRRSLVRVRRCRGGSARRGAR